MNDSDLSPLETLKATHRKEKKELQAKITSLKHAVPKSDGKKKREVGKECEKMEKDLKKRHEDELAALELETKPIDAKEELSEDTAFEAVAESSESNKQPRITKAQKRRDKKAELQKRFIEAAEEDEKNAKFAPGNIETEAIISFLATHKLSVHEIPPDGDCLYNAIAHQLSLFPSKSVQSTCKDVRRKAAAYIRAHKDDFLPFLTSEDGSPIDEFDFDEYCGKVERNCDEGGQWGGEPELRALSSVLEKRIEVVQPEGRLVVFGEEFSSSKPLIVTYHRHAYSLGEHYNSTKPLVSVQNDSF